MSPIEISALSVVGGVLGGGLAGATVAYCLRPLGLDVDEPDEELERDLEDQIRASAQGYAQNIGRPEASELIANKLRVGARVEQRRRQRGRWGR